MNDEYDVEQTEHDKRVWDCLEFLYEVECEHKDTKDRLLDILEDLLL